MIPPRPRPALAERTADLLWETVSDNLHAAARAALPGAFAAVLTWTIPPRSALPERPTAPRGQLEIPGAG